MTDVVSEVIPTESSLPSATTTESSSLLSSSTSATNKSALQDNIDRRGTNAYYYAHSHRANGPAWDGKAEPKLLATHQVQEGHKTILPSSTFDYSTSNITTYAFLDDGPKVKLYIDLEGVGEKCSDEDVTLDYSEISLCLKVNNYQSPAIVVTSSASQPAAPRCLCFAKLSGPISSASFKLKTNRIILTLVKVNPEEAWHTINDKGSPDHDLV